MPLKTEGEVAEILASIREAYSQLEAEYELQREQLHKKAAENAKLRVACELLAGWADYGGDAVAMLDDAVDAARKALGDGFSYFEVLRMRQLTSHKVNGLNEDLTIDVVDEPGCGGACHKYAIGYNLNPGTDAGGVHHMAMIEFQNGPVQENGVNGISNEALLAIVEDRLAGFQSGEFSNRETAIALTKVQEAMLWLAKRTRDRIARGVEGTLQKMKTRDELDLESYHLKMEHRGWSTWKWVDESWCYYWWWDEDPDGLPIPVHVMHSPTEDKFFASVGQHGWNQPQNVEDMGGWWMKITPPDVTRHPQS